MCVCGGGGDTAAAVGVGCGTWGGGTRGNSPNQAQLGFLGVWCVCERGGGGRGEVAPEAVVQNQAQLGLLHAEREAIKERHSCLLT